MEDFDDKKYVEEHQQEEIEVLNNAVAYFSNKGKPDREFYIVATFLKCLGVPFKEVGIKVNSEQDHPIDVFFEDAQFQITEIMDRERRRHTEYKKRLEKVKTDPTIDDFFRQYTPEDITYEDITDLITQCLSKDKFKKYPPAVRANLDVLIYVNLYGKILDTKSLPPECTELCAQGWRSVSMLFSGSYGYVFCASKTAPSFITGNIGVLHKG